MSAIAVEQTRDEAGRRSGRVPPLALEVQTVRGRAVEIEGRDADLVPGHRPGRRRYQHASGAVRGDAGLPEAQQSRRGTAEKVIGEPVMPAKRAPRKGAEKKPRPAARKAGKAAVMAPAGKRAAAGPRRRRGTVGKGARNRPTKRQRARPPSGRRCAGKRH